MSAHISRITLSIVRPNDADLDNPKQGKEKEEAGPAVHEHSDTWGFAWMPVIESFVAQAVSEGEESEDDSRIVDVNEAHDETVSPREVRRDSDAEVDACSRAFSGRFGRKRRRPRPLSYNETLLADKAFHNPHASETMADAYGILRPASFVLDVRGDDRSWGGGTGAAEGDDPKNVARDDGGESDDGSWFYDTVRDRQNRLWADSRVRKGVDLAREGEHQVRSPPCKVVWYGGIGQLSSSENAEHPPRVLSQLGDSSMNVALTPMGIASHVGLRLFCIWAEPCSFAPRF